MPKKKTSSFSEQETFNFVVRHLIRQGRAATYMRQCMYRTPEGLKCAIGCLIPDDKYCPSMEGTGAESLRLIYSDVLPPVRATLLHGMQRAHDQHDISIPVGLSRWANAMHQVALDHGLMSPKALRLLLKR